MQRFSWLPEYRRAWLYRVLLAVVPILIAYGAVKEADAALWVALAGAVLGTGTASAHTSTDPKG
jgi:hypothetical protein